ncbi:hypothetical protein ASPSYDRAFT_1169703 [Aspergillus sydowii CBS 593.65]|uniref:NADH:flavin oxidoreductase/NADH oxidase N-terminal domain-containing protein n=1 Tax=Aspergillus sydowii CBS 593.65 TaxID=1036612 RepID=A0A1L9SYN3_9EURO|nr:uncharacterized protein ASPSYDRAFT_1169703 [Aspergillus sydowii CBS 593.65]OJJ52332.1 hypothetical protein ASPSYDRAFT_1169703 [Aspergillus sydowii CBS 593.65]
MASTLFHPLRIGTVELQHRVVMAPLTRLRADSQHVQPPIATTSLPPKVESHGPGIWSEAQIQGWKNITDAIHAKGSYAFCQLIALGRAADLATLKQEGNYELLAPSTIPIDPTRPENTPKELSQEQITDIVQNFAAAAKNAIRAGFDGVEIHDANGYLVDQFLQDVTNRRSDQWGGSVSNRSRFAIEVVKAVVDAVGSEKVGFRISPWNILQGMKMLNPIPQFTYLVEQLKELKLAYLTR